MGWLPLMAWVKLIFGHYPKCPGHTNWWVSIFSLLWGAFARNTRMRMGWDASLLWPAGHSTALLEDTPKQHELFQASCGGHLNKNGGNITIWETPSPPPHHAYDCFPHIMIAYGAQVTPLGCPTLCFNLEFLYTPKASKAKYTCS